MDLNFGIGAPGSIETFILMGLGNTPGSGGGGGVPGSGVNVFATTGISALTGANEEEEME